MYFFKFFDFKLYNYQKTVFKTNLKEIKKKLMTAEDTFKIIQYFLIYFFF